MSEIVIDSIGSQVAGSLLEALLDLLIATGTTVTPYRRNRSGDCWRRHGRAILVGISVVVCLDRHGRFEIAVEQPLAGSIVDSDDGDRDFSCGGQRSAKRKVRGGLVDDDPNAGSSLTPPTLTFIALSTASAKSNENG